MKAKRRRAPGTGRMTYLKTMARRFKNGSQKGQTGVSTNVVTANFMFWGGTFGVLPSTYLYLLKSARAYLFPQPVKTHYFLQRPH